jgi:hypothetical protein
VFRVPLASASAGALGVPGVPYQMRRGLVPVMSLGGGSRTDRAGESSAPQAGAATPASDLAAEEASRSEASVPWAHAGPTPIAETRRIDASFRAPWGESESKNPFVVITTEPWPVEWWRVPRTAPLSAAATSNPMAVAASPFPAARSRIVPLEVPQHADRPRARTRRRETPRRGLLARIALVAFGLVVSLLAVESASKRRR